jgi:putative transposase
MPTRNVTFAPGEFYHVYNRGTEKRTIFKDKADYNRFIELLFLSNSSKSVNVRDLKKTFKNIFEFDRGKALVSIGAYCLMPNHFHILITPLSDEGLAKFMNKLSTSYSMYFNKRFERTGSLFEGTYKAKHADTDEYLKYLFSYIHLNPVKLIQPDWKEKGIVNREKAYQYVSSFQYSSLPDYVGHDRKEGVILETGAFPEYFVEHKDHETELFEWLSFASKDNINP